MTHQEPNENDAPKQPWFNELVNAEKTKLTHEDMMGSVVDFTNFTKHCLKKYKTTKVDLEGDRIPQDFSKPLPFLGAPGRLYIPIDFFFNKDLGYLRSGNLEEKKYATSFTKPKAARYEIYEIKEMISNPWSSSKVAYDKDVAYEISHWGLKQKLIYKSRQAKQSNHTVYSRMKILSIVRISVDKQFGYGYLKEIVVKRANRKEYIFKEADFTILLLNDIEDMFLLYYQNKLHHLNGNVQTDMAVALWFFIRRTILNHRVKDVQLGVESYQTKLNLTRPQVSAPVIMEYLVKIKKKARILELKRRHLKITVRTSYTPLVLALSDRHPTYRETPSDRVNIDDPNITMEDNIRLEEEKDRRNGKVYNWETATYGRIWDDDEVHNLGSVETEFPAIVFDDTFTSEAALSCEPMVSPLNDNEINFRISFDESDDEDYTVIFDKNSFSYKIIYVDNLKTNSENDNDKVDMPSLPSPEPMVGYFDDLNYLKDFENEFPAIVYNDALTSKLNFLTEPSMCPQHVDEFDLKNETSLSEYNEEEQNVLYFNDLFLFNIIYPDDLKSDKDNDDNEIDIIQSSGITSIPIKIVYGVSTLEYVVSALKNRMINLYNLCTDFIKFANMAFPPRDQRHQCLRFESLGYTDADITDFEERLELMTKGLSGKMLMENRDAQGQSVFTSRAWRRLFEIRGPLVHELILEFFSTFRFGEAVLDLDIAGALQFQLGGVMLGF
ncbi:hypothetical protein Tco_0402133 [Tanacetum coccineum]